MKLFFYTFLLILMTLGILGHPSFALAQVSCGKLFNDGKISLPSGKVIEIANYVIDKQVMDDFNIFFLKSKKAYLDDAEGSGALGSVYKETMSLKQRMTANPNNPLKNLYDQELAALISYSEWGYQEMNRYLNKRIETNEMSAQQRDVT